MKLTLANFYRSGGDRRRGYFWLGSATGRQITPYANTYSVDKTSFFVNFLGGGETPARPYCYLLAHYGAGNNSYSATGQCLFQDFLAYAARVDYAVASNLNLFASCIFAQRASNTGTPQGFYNGTWAPQVDTNQANAPNSGTISGNSFMPFTWYVTPNVPDNDLGWEVNAGINWKLLENFRFDALFAYWKPGKWFNWAYRDMTSSNPYIFDPNDPRTITGLVHPERRIDAIMAYQLGFRADF